MKNLLFLALTLGLVSQVFSQQKHALVVAIGDYPIYENSSLNWKDISSMNDVELLKALFAKQEFNSNDVTFLLNEKATSPTLQKSFDSITLKLERGDIFYFHFSGHGQQVADLAPKDYPKIKHIALDEQDGLDECLVLYNAPQRLFEGYDYSAHFYDDQLNYYLTRIQQKIGPTGQVIVVIDACHSGTATRGAEELVVRGSNVALVPEGYQMKNNSDNTLGFDADLNFKNDEGLAPMVAFFGCKAEQVNREIQDRNGKGYGSLTYYLTKSFYELNENASFQNLFAKINEKMILKFRNEQHPVLEGTQLNQTIFNGRLVVQEPFFELLTIESLQATINGGQLNGLQVGDTLGFYPNTTTNIKESNVLFKGVLTQLGVQQSTIKLLTPFNGRAEEYVRFRAFNINPVNNANLIVLKLGLESKALKKEAQKFFSSQKDVQLVESNFNYLLIDTLIGGQPHVRVYLGNNRINALRAMPFRNIQTEAGWDSLLTDIRQSVRTDVFRKLQIENSNVDVAFQLLDNNKNPINTQNLAFKEGEKFSIVLTNKSSIPVYFNLIDIYPDNRLFIDPRLKNKLIPPNKEFTIPTGVEKPYGLEQFKFIFTEQPIDLSSLEKNGSTLTRGGGSSPLLEFVDAQASGTRGMKADDLNNVAVMSLIFEIKKP